MGNPGNRPIPEDEPETAGPLGSCPEYLNDRAKALWSEVAQMCWWLGDADAFTLAQWCALQSEFEAGPADMSASRISQLRALGSELGLNPSARARLGTMKGNRSGEQKPSGGQKPDAKPDYFN